MQIIGILSLTHHVKDWLVNSSHPRVLHVFDRVCNLINEDGDVLSIVAPQIGNGPFNVVIENDILFSKYVEIDSGISILGDQVTLGDLVLETANAQFWDASPDWEKLHRDRDHIADQLAKIPIPDSRLPNSLISSLSFALLKADIVFAKSNASRLAGLGIGLTPSGDDFMMGALYASWVIHPRELARLLAQEIVNIAAPLTTSLSAAWLRSAGRGEAGNVWHELFEALTYSDIISIRSSIDKILAVGSTSGADALAGFTSMFMVYKEFQKNYVIPKFI